MLLWPAVGCSDDGVPATTDMGSGSSGVAETTSASETSSVTASTDPSSTSGASSSSSSTDTGSSEGSTGVDSSGTGSDSSTGGPPATCEDASDCMLVEDCCNCTTISVGAEPPPCEQVECDQTACDAIGVVPELQCELGSCEFVPVPCNPSVACDSLPPKCPAGTLPSVNEQESCWTGLCVPAEICDVVPSCSDCPDDQVCIAYVSQLPVTECSPIPQACDGQPSCACMGAEVCLAPFDICNDIDEGLSCGCPVC